MLFSSTEFLFLFLPISLIIYGILPVGIKNLVLLLLSLLFYALGDAKFLPLLLLLTLLDFAFGFMVEKTKKEIRRKILLWVAVIINIAFLGFFKYTNTIATLFGVKAEIALPMGISFYVFQGLSYVIDVYKRKTQAERDAIRFGAYITLFPQLVAGPIVKYTDVREELLQKRRFSLERFASGVRLFFVGLAKKVLIANFAGEVFDRLLKGNITFLGGWTALVFFALQIYYDFSGYTDMARGLGRLFGFEFPENFNYPYISKSITEFWRRWHMTLSSWFREYVYIPLGGSREGRAKTVRNLFVVWLLTGIWHGAGLGFALWGLYFFLLLVAEKFIYGEALKKMPSIISHAYALFFILLGWLIFASSDMGGEKTLSLLGAIFAGAGGFYNRQSFYELMRNIPFLVISIFGATPLPKIIYQRFIDKKLLLRTSCDLLGIAVFFVTVAYIIGSGYNPFLYFRF
ncbi:MAG: MBOAT family protein [Clostridia bacterium]|nr:MBOAT family protein [Clostridia bacterium]